MKYKLSAGDDPTGPHALPSDIEDISLLNSTELARASAEAEGRNDFGVMKGKGKGGKGNGRCHTCGGEGHFTRNCPSVVTVGPHLTEGHGCHGRGHYKTACPTANPHLKSVGKGWGKGKSGGKEKKRKR